MRKTVMATNTIYSTLIRNNLIQSVIRDYAFFHCSLKSFTAAGTVSSLLP
jgi:hypothetical protein